MHKPSEQKKRDMGGKLEGFDPRDLTNRAVCQAQPLGTGFFVNSSSVSKLAFVDC